MLTETNTVCALCDSDLTFAEESDPYCPKCGKGPLCMGCMEDHDHAPITVQPIAECPIQERMLRALVAIEMMVMELADDAPENKLYARIYTIAHAATGCCGNPHLDWLAEIEKSEAHGAVHNRYHVDRVLHKFESQFAESQDRERAKARAEAGGKGL
jgi:hypothetical protein